MQAMAWPLEKLLPWAALGGGLGVGVFRTPDDETEPMEVTDAVPIVRASVGVGYEVHRRVTVGLSANYDWVFTGDSVTVQVGSRRDEVTVFDDTVHFAVGIDHFF